jgi:hypothetical protein
VRDPSSVVRRGRRHEPKDCRTIRREIFGDHGQKYSVALKPEFEIQTDALPDLMRVRYFGHVTAAGMQACCAEIERLLPQTRAGFTTLTDLSALESMDLDCVRPLTRIMDVCRAKGIGRVVRVIPDPDKDIGFNLLSIIHYRRGVRIVTCETLAEAERVVNPPSK